MPRNLRSFKKSDIKLKQFNSNIQNLPSISANAYNLKPLCQDVELSRPNQAFYQSQDWLRLSGEFKRAYPYCFRCGKGNLRLVCDHVLEIRDQPELKLERSNLQNLCYPCHALKTAEAKRARKFRRQELSV